MKKIQKSDIIPLSPYCWEIPDDFKPGMRVPARIIAEEALLEGYGILVASRGDDHEQTRRVVGYLADLYDARHAAEPEEGFDSKAAEWRARTE